MTTTHPCRLCRYREGDWCKVYLYMTAPAWADWHSIDNDRPEKYKGCDTIRYHTCPECGTKWGDEDQRLQQCSNCDWSA